jgi:hypothetical protein
MGFRIVHVDGAEASRIREELEAKRIEEEEDAENKRLEGERVKAIKLAPMEADVDSRIKAFINALEAEDRFKDLHDTRRMVVEHFLYSIEDYRVNIVAGTGRNDALFKNLFDSSLSVYWPIEQLRRKVQALQIALHKLEQLRKNLPDFVEEDFSRYGLPGFEILGLDDDGDLDDEVKTENQFEREMTRDECSDVVELDDVRNYYRVEWSDISGEAFWTCETLNSGEALAWLSGRAGQEYLDAIDAEIQKAIQAAKSDIQLVMTLSDAEWSCEVGSSRYKGVPSPLQLLEILKLLKFKSDIAEVNSLEFELTVHW